MKSMVLALTMVLGFTAHADDTATAITAGPAGTATTAATPAIGTPRAVNIEIDGQALSPAEVTAVVYVHQVLPNFKSAKLNGRELQPTILFPGGSVYIHADTAAGTKATADQVMDKHAVICGQAIAPAPQGVNIVGTIQLQSGQAAMIATQEAHLKAVGQKYVLFLCPANTAAAAPTTATAANQ